MVCRDLFSDFLSHIHLRMIILGITYEIPPNDGSHKIYVNSLLTSPDFHLFVVAFAQLSSAQLSSNHKFFHFILSFFFVAFLWKHFFFFLSSTFIHSKYLSSDYGHVKCESRVGERGWPKLETRRSWNEHVKKLNGATEMSCPTSLTVCCPQKSRTSLSFNYVEAKRSDTEGGGRGNNHDGMSQSKTKLK